MHDVAVNKFRGTNLTKTLDHNGDLYWKGKGRYKSCQVAKNGVITCAVGVFKADQRASSVTFSDSGKLYVAGAGAWSSAGHLECCSKPEE